MTFFQALAIDFDGTLTLRGEVSTKALDAIDQARRNGLVVVLVTGRIGAELKGEFPQIVDHVDAVVLENGAVAVINGRTRVLCAPVDIGLDDALVGRGVPFRRGLVLVAFDGEHAATVIEVIGQLGLDCQIIRNRAAVMVLPAGVTKGNGLGAVLTELNLSAHNTIAVGMPKTTCRCSRRQRSVSRWPMPSRRSANMPILCLTNPTGMVSSNC